MGSEESEMNASADWGDLYSFVTHMKEEARKRGVDLLLVDVSLVLVQHDLPADPSAVDPQVWRSSRRKWIGRHGQHQGPQSPPNCV
jgi:hypothetical protein